MMILTTSPPRDSESMSLRLTIESAFAADAELLVVVGGEEHLGVLHILPGAFAEKAVHHPLIVAFRAEAGTHQESQFERVEVLELIQSLQFLESADGECHLMVFAMAQRVFGELVPSR
jgi:hypothetical protein